MGQYVSRVDGPGLYPVKCCEAPDQVGGDRQQGAPALVAHGSHLKVRIDTAVRPAVRQLKSDDTPGRRRHQQPAPPTVGKPYSSVVGFCPADLESLEQVYNKAF